VLVSAKPLKKKKEEGQKKINESGNATRFPLKTDKAVERTRKNGEKLAGKRRKKSELSMRKPMIFQSLIASRHEPSQQHFLNLTFASGCS